MKKIVKVLMLFTALLLFAVVNSNAQQLVVKVHPVHSGPEAVRPPRTSQTAVWAGPQWASSMSKKAYIEQPGHWVEPPHKGAVWVDGYWAKHSKGYVWVAGRWK